MAGAGPRTLRVDVVNANWTPGDGEVAGRFELLLVTEDGERHVVAASPAELTALTGLFGPRTVLLWDPDAGTLITANVVGDWLPQDWSRGEGR